MYKILVTIGLSLLGGVLYRLGGIGGKFDTKIRDLGVPSVAIGAPIYLGINWSWQMGAALFFMFGLMFGAMTTYFKSKKQEDTYWWNWLITGFVYGLSALPYTLVTGNWLGFSIRTVILAVTIMGWSELISKDWLEEGGRGFLFIVTLPLLMI